MHNKRHIREMREVIRADATVASPAPFYDALILRTPSKGAKWERCYSTSPFSNMSGMFGVLGHLSGADYSFCPMAAERASHSKTKLARPKNVSEMVLCATRQTDHVMFPRGMDCSAPRINMGLNGLLAFDCVDDPRPVALGPDGNGHGLMAQSLFSKNMRMRDSRTWKGAWRGKIVTKSWQIVYMRSLSILIGVVMIMCALRPTFPSQLRRIVS